MTGFKFVEATSMNDLTESVADGMIGLSPPGQNMKPDSFISELYSQGLIEANMFSLFMGSVYKNQSSALWLGGYDLSVLSNFE